ncbi:MAG: alpha-L-fucosidase [Planctomycetota bacterium]
MHPMFQNHQRQIHLDFHTSPFIPDVGSTFDADQFVETFQRAHVNSVTVFGKCHHGMCYYPTTTGVSHPAIGDRDLLGEQLEALHRAGIRAPIYTTVVWEENVAQEHPEWHQMAYDGSFVGDGVGPDGRPGHLGMWKFNNLADPGYQDYFEAHLRELLERYGDAVDGLFIDILFFHPTGGWSEPSRAIREKHGLTDNTPDHFARFQGLAQQAFSERFTSLIHSIRPQASVFYNTGNDGNMHPLVGPRVREPHMTHMEIESLPSGFWGYHHFPRMARAMSRWGKPWLSMTGRFQKMWGDFGGIKPQPALEFECFRAQALGGAGMVGDQLPPRGTLDPAAYQLIGAVYEQWEQAEPFYADAELCPAPIGVFSANFAGQDNGVAEEAAVMLSEEAHYDCAMLDGYDGLEGHDLIILPDSTVVSEDVAQRLKAYYEAGGKLLISHKAGRDEAGRWALDFIPLEDHGEVERYPSYWRGREAFDPEMAVGDRVFYKQGLNVTFGGDVEVLCERALPYFMRSALKFSSHFQTPPVAESDAFSAIFRGERFIYFADPIFAEYRQSGNPAVQLAWRRAVELLIGGPAYGRGLANSIAAYPMRRGADLQLTLLHYTPVRKAMDIDVIDQRGGFAGQVLNFTRPVNDVQVFGTGATLERLSDRSFKLPEASGRLLLTVPGYF